MNKKNRRSFGYIRRLPSKLYQASYVGPDGHRYYGPRSFVAKADADGFLAQELTSINKQEWIPPHSRADKASTPHLTLRKVAPEYFSMRTTRTGEPLRRLTRDLYERLLNKTMEEWLDVPLHEIKQENFSKWYMKMQAEGKKTTASKCYTLLRAILSWAVEKEMLEVNPVFIKGGYTSSSGRESQVLTGEQIKLLVQAIEPELRFAVQLAAYAGLRFSELSALERQDLIFTQGADGSELTIRVDKGATRVRKLGSTQPHGKYEIVVGPPKSKMSKRLIAVHSGLVVSAKEHLDCFVGHSPKSLVFGIGENRQEYMRYDYFEHRYSRAKNLIGCADVDAPIHSLRKFGATEFANSGANLTELSEWLGDNSIEAIKRYIKSNGRARSLANKMTFEK
jgi:integrase